MTTSETVIREVADGVWTFSRPFKRSGLFPFGGRSTAVKLSDGGVWFLASTPPDDETTERIKALGPVKYIIGPDAEHSISLGKYKALYPDAKLVGVAPHLSKPHLAGVEFAGAYGKDEPGTQYGFEGEIEAVYFSGFENLDVAFFHKASKSLIEADLLFNLPGHEQYSKSKQSATFPLIGSLSPYTWAHKKFLWALGKDKEAMKRDAKAVDAWDFERIIPCHGDVIEKDAKKAWSEAYKWYLVGK